MAQSIKWYIDRLSVMSADEVAQRFWSIYLKKTQKNAWEKAKKIPFNTTTINPNPSPQLPDRKTCPETTSQAIHAEAEDILEGKWNILRGLTWQVDPATIDWQKDYLNGTQCTDTAPAHAINHRNITNFDARASWEPSRFIQLVRVAQSAWLEKNQEQAEKKARWVQQTLADWLEKNPLGIGIQWTSPMEPGLRLINLTWIDALLCETSLSESLKNDWQTILEKLLPSHVWWVWRYRSFGSSANNHLLGELAGLALALNRWSKLEQFSTDRANLKNIIEKQTLLQFHSDGGNIEEALHYHHFAWEMVWQSHKAFEASPISGFSKETTERIARAAKFFTLLGEDEEPWDFGDSDDAHITPLYSAERKATHEWKAYMKGEKNAVNFWLGEAPKTDYKAEQIGSWQHFKESGYLTATTEENIKCRLDASNLGMGKMAAHGHIDALHLSIWDDKQALIIDPGTGGYFGHDEKRLELAAKESHNSPYFEDADLYPRRGGLFMWCGGHKKPEVQLTEQQCQATIHWKNQHSIQRNISLEKNKITIKDELKGTAENAQLNWIFAPEWELKETEGKIIAKRGEKTWEIECSSNKNLSINIGKQMISPSYGIFAEAPSLQLKLHSTSEQKTITTSFVRIKK